MACGPGEFCGSCAPKSSGSLCADVLSPGWAVRRQRECDHLSIGRALVGNPQVGAPFPSQGLPSERPDPHFCLGFSFSPEGSQGATASGGVWTLW